MNWVSEAWHNIKWNARLAYDEAKGMLGVILLSLGGLLALLIALVVAGGAFVAAVKLVKFAWHF